jgi:phospholipid-binding lipoprotein MlaA
MTHRARRADRFRRSTHRTGWVVLAGACLALAAGPARATGPRAAAAAPATRADSAALEASDALYDEAGLGTPTTSEVPDPLETVNRGILVGNRAMDRVLLDPVTKTYRRIVPGPVKSAVRNFFDNLNEPVIFVNDLLQLEGARAHMDIGRFLLNSTVGLAGLWDPASHVGMPAHHADFGQTLGKMGVPPGIYLMLPLLGPSTTRDAVGSFVDMALRPDTWIFPLGTRVVLTGTWGISEREAHLDALEALEHSSVDYYAALRSAYCQNREALVRDEGIPVALRSDDAQLAEEAPGHERLYAGPGMRR